MATLTCSYADFADVVLRITTITWWSDDATAEWCDVKTIVLVDGQPNERHNLTRFVTLADVLRVAPHLMSIVGWPTSALDTGTAFCRAWDRTDIECAACKDCGLAPCSVTLQKKQERGPNAQRPQPPSRGFGLSPWT